MIVDAASDNDDTTALVYYRNDSVESMWHRLVFRQSHAKANPKQQDNKRRDELHFVCLQERYLSLRTLWHYGQALPECWHGDRKVQPSSRRHRHVHHTLLCSVQKVICDIDRFPLL